MRPWCARSRSGAPKDSNPPATAIGNAKGDVLISDSLEPCIGSAQSQILFTANSFESPPGDSDVAPTPLDLTVMES